MNVSARSSTACGMALRENLHPQNGRRYAIARRTQHCATSTTLLPKVCSVIVAKVAAALASSCRIERLIVNQLLQKAQRLKKIFSYYFENVHFPVLSEPRRRMYPFVCSCFIARATVARPRLSIEAYSS